MKVLYNQKEGRLDKMPCIEFIGQVMASDEEEVKAATKITLTSLVQLKYERDGLETQAALVMAEKECYGLRDYMIAELYEQEVGPEEWCSIPQFVFLRTIFSFTREYHYRRTESKDVITEFKRRGPLRGESVESLTALMATYYSKNEDERALSLWPPPPPAPPSTRTAQTQT